MVQIRKIQDKNLNDGVRFLALLSDGDSVVVVWGVSGHRLVVVIILRTELLFVLKLFVSAVSFSFSNLSNVLVQPSIFSQS